MLKLIGLELKRNNIRSYVMASFCACVILLAFIYFVAYVAQVESGAREIQFQNYGNIFRFTGTMSLIIFSIMSAVMYSRLIISEYSGKRAALLFSYPVKRDKILLDTLQLLGIAILAVGGIGIVSMRIGFVKKSVPTTLIAAFILSAIYGNAAISTNGTLLGLIVGGTGILATVFVMAELSNKVKKMEVE